MRRVTSASDVVHTLVSQPTHIDTVQEMFPSTEQDRRDGEVQLINECSAEILANCGYAPTQPDVAAACRIPRSLERSVNTVGDEPKLRATLHFEQRPGVMSQHEDRRVVRRLVTPPAFPGLIRPRAPDRAEHVTAENPGAD